MSNLSKAMASPAVLLLCASGLKPAPESANFRPRSNTPPGRAVPALLSAPLPSRDNAVGSRNDSQDPIITMSESGRPFIILTAICDASARPAAVTVGHGDAMVRAITATEGLGTEGLDLVELPIAPAAFAALRKHLDLPADVVTAYDIFPLSAALKPEYRPVAGQFLAAEVLWTLEEQGMLGGVPFTVQFDVPPGWDKDPKKLHERLVKERALELDAGAIETFKSVKTAWEAAKV